MDENLQRRRFELIEEDASFTCDLEELTARFHAASQRLGIEASELRLSAPIVQRGCCTELDLTFSGERRETPDEAFERLVAEEARERRERDRAAVMVRRAEQELDAAQARASSLR